MIGPPGLTIQFGASGNSLPYLTGGWAAPEADFTWAIGQESQILLPVRPDTRDLVLTLSVIPFVHEKALPFQRLTVLMSGTTIGTARVGQPSVLSWRIPAALIRGAQRVLITLSHPDSTRPSDISDVADDRELAFSISELRVDQLPDSLTATVDVPPGLGIGGLDRPGFGVQARESLEDWVVRRTGLTLSALASSFESLGENCEFGLVQRACDTEPLGLLRFSGSRGRDLVHGIETGFAGIGELSAITPRLSEGSPREYMIHEGRYGLVYHTFVYEGERTPDVLRQQESTRLTFLRRKFMDELEAGDKLFVFKSAQLASDAEILPLWLALNRDHANTLLWVVPEEPGHPSGSVEVVMKGLLKAYIDRFAPPEQAERFALDSWVQVCVHAYLLNRLIRRLG